MYNWFEFNLIDASLTLSWSTLPYTKTQKIQTGPPSHILPLIMRKLIMIIKIKTLPTL